ncbi:cyclic AMP-responsive element-binding protein 3-like protein 4 isoform X1 [Nelusetta ayraudi]|uniref:cyclic AMP-responsive element-binding protein 3-like protein 4 isoform X1 n=1 Tax=Nelusetta ayraudi TaxID=303726 RepID=UPI003F7163F1
MDGELFVGVSADSWQLDPPFSCELPSGQEWALDPELPSEDEEDEDVLHAVDPNEVFPRAPPPDPSPSCSSSESDSGISEDPAVVEAPPTTAAALYQVVYDLSSVKTEPGDVISIELDEWSHQMLFADSCVVSELPVLAPPSPYSDLVRHAAAGFSLIGQQLTLLLLLQLRPDLQLTEEEQKLLSQEGVSLPNNLPLTKAEEKILKRVRRKIRNKQSAQDSRRRRKEYIDGLESRAAACSAQNKELQRTVEQLEKRNMSLLAQLRRLQSLVKQTASKGAQTSTCLLIILVSLSLIIMPSFSPFRRSSADSDDYRPTGVISRNILTDTAASTQQEALQSESAPSPSDNGQSEPLDKAGLPPEPADAAVRNLGVNGTFQEESQSENGSAPVARQTELPGLRSGNLDSAQKTHADEM